MGTQETEAVKVEVVMYQHEDTGIVGFIDQQQIDWGFWSNNPRLHPVGDMMTVAQHERIVAAITATTATGVIVPRELLERIATPCMGWYATSLREGDIAELRALLQSQQQEVKS